jgi:Ca2+-binding RTX toxin-like protein
MPTLTDPKWTAGVSAISFAANNQTFRIAAGILVGSSANDAVYDAAFYGSRLINKGTIFSAAGSSFSGVLFNGDDGTIINKAGAIITGVHNGITLRGDGTMIANDGAITSTEGNGVVFAGPSSHAALDNGSEGEIYAPIAAVLVFSTNDGGTIDNSGSIRSDTYGVHIIGAPGIETVINNADGATINGGIGAIRNEANGRITLTNRGTIDGDVDCNAFGAKDWIVNKGRITGDVTAGPGNDVFKGEGGKSVVVFGEGGKDKLTGGSKSDTLDGGPGRDRLDGRFGDDMLTGGPGKDKIVFDTNLNAGSNVDTITDLKPGVDSILLSKAVFAGIGPTGTLKNKYFHIGNSAADDTDRIIYNDDSGKFFYDNDGKGGADQVLFAKAAHHLALDAGDFVVIA